MTSDNHSPLSIFAGPMMERLAAATDGVTKFPQGSLRNQAWLDFLTINGNFYLAGKPMAGLARGKEGNCWYHQTALSRAHNIPYAQGFAMSMEGQAPFCGEHAWGLGPSHEAWDLTWPAERTGQACYYGVAIAARDVAECLRYLKRRALPPEEKVDEATFMALMATYAPEVLWEKMLRNSGIPVLEAVAASTLERDD